MNDENKKSQAENENTSDSNKKQKNVFEEFGESVGQFATRTFESIKQTIDNSMSSRNTVLTIRVSDDANKKLSMLVDSGIFKSRSESAAFLIEEGIKHQEGLFKRISEKLQKIEQIKEELKGIITDEMSGKAFNDSN